jgi:hypothetical protein
MEGQSKTNNKTPAPTRKDPATKGPQQGKFNLETYKYHALGIQYLISEQGELEHC